MSTAQSGTAPAGCVAKLRVSAQRPLYVTGTSKLVDPEPVFPATSVAVAVSVFDPGRVHAGAETSWHVDEAMPESASVALHVIVTVSVSA